MEVHVSNDSQTLICITYIGASLPSTALQLLLKNFTMATQTKEYQIQALLSIYFMYAMSIFIKTTFPMGVPQLSFLLDAATYVCFAVVDSSVNNWYYLRIYNTLQVPLEVETGFTLKSKHGVLVKYEPRK